jgi:hypothetical protein
MNITLYEILKYIAILMFGGLMLWGIDYMFRPIKESFGGNCKK